MPSPADLGDLLVPLSAAAVTGYLLGSLPFGYLVARSRGVNIFEVGSRSPGATNVRRVLGSVPGTTVFVLDTLKGVLAAALPLLAALHYARTQGQPAGASGAAHLAGADAAARFAALAGYLGLAFAIVGHAFSCFTRLRGGKGVATAAGGLLVLMPFVALISGAIWLAIFYTTRYVSLASILAALCLPPLALLFGRGAMGIWVAVAIALFVVVRHRANVGRLLKGTEKRFERKKPGGPPPGGNP
ncbi:MAG TPA: glycerol-3-phosphate 1-O-acyltransferase PlsY [Opitutaceae bacterium]|nr:glycerol-3-phosphate 1-O-acyltransferase PlsY [Opitutaceae bacterium]